MLCESIFPAAKTPDAIVLALSYCKARRLDPFKRNIHIVPIYDSKKGAEVETVWPGIAELRTTAMRTKGYAGMAPPEFGPKITRTFKDSEKSGQNYVDKQTEVTFPAWCRITVFRIVQGNTVPFPGPTVEWLEFYNKKSRYVDAPNEQWRRRPSQMLEKCAEAGALRRAFPEEFGEDYTVEEIGAFGSLATTQPVDAEVIKTTPPAEPRRSDFRQSSDAEEVEKTDAAETQVTNDAADHDPEAGEVKQAAVDQQQARSWAISDSIVGQDARLKAVIELLSLAETAAHVDEIAAEHRAFLDKLGSTKKSDTRRLFDDRKIELANGAEGAAA